MSEKRQMSRRAGLKALGAVGAGMALGGSVGLQAKQAVAGQEKPPANVVDVATGRMAKGHS